MIMRRNFLLRHMDLFMEFFYYVPCLGYLNPDIWYKDINVSKKKSVYIQISMLLTVDRT